MAKLDTDNEEEKDQIDEQKNESTLKIDSKVSVKEAKDNASVTGTEVVIEGNATVNIIATEVYIPKRKQRASDGVLLSTFDENVFVPPPPEPDKPPEEKIFVGREDRNSVSIANYLILQEWP